LFSREGKKKRRGTSGKRSSRRRINCSREPQYLPGRKREQGGGVKRETGNLGIRENDESSNTKNCALEKTAF